MSDQFTTYSMKIFNELNEAVIKKLSTLESKEIDKTINNLMKIEDTFTEMETKLKILLQTFSCAYKSFPV